MAALDFARVFGVPWVTDRSTLVAVGLVEVMTFSMSAELSLSPAAALVLHQSKIETISDLLAHRTNLSPMPNAD